jgi:hypothetical protein
LHLDAFKPRRFDELIINDFGGLMKKRETFEYLHAKPTNRREFLAAGLIPFSAFMFMPSWLKIFAQSGVAQAQDLICKSAAAGDLCPFISIKLSGGAAMSANFLPHDAGQQLLPSYSKMGMGSGGTLQVDHEFANRAPFYAGSQILAGIRLRATPDALMKSSFVGVCVRSQDDSSGNKFDITGLVAKSGLGGKILPNLGKANTETGVNNSYAYLRPPAPLIVGRYEDITGSLSVTGSLSALSDTQKVKLFQNIQDLTTTQAQNIQNMTGGTVLAQLIQCANIDNSKLISSGGNLNTDPLSNQAFATAWGINNNTAKNSQDFVFASMVYNALNGNSGTVNLEIGGFDYHNNTRTSGDAKDLEAGQVIGRVIQSMNILGKKGFIVVTSDGSVTSPDSDTAGGPWVSDRGTGGSSYMIGFDPLGAHTVKSFQVGQFTSGQVADDTFVTGGSAEIAGGGMFANYLAFNAKLGQIETYLPRVFTSDQLDKIAMFT